MNAQFLSTIKTELAKHPQLKKLDEAHLNALAEVFDSWPEIAAYEPSDFVALFAEEPNATFTETQAKALIAKAKSEVAESVSATAGASATVQVSATLTPTQEPVNPWLEKVSGLRGDVRLSAYAANVALGENARQVLVRIGKLQAMTLLDQSGLRAAIIGIAQLTADGKSKRKMPMQLADKIYAWYRLVLKNDASIMSADERLDFAKEVGNLVHPDLEAMLTVAVMAKSGKANMKAMGAGSSFDVGKFGSLGPDEISEQLPDVLKVATDKAQMSFVLQKYAIFAAEYEDHLYGIVESREFQTMCGITPGEDPRTTVAEALENAGYPLAGAAFRASVDTEMVWQFFGMVPDDGDEQYALALGEIGARVIRDNAQVKRIVESMEEKEVVVGAEAAVKSFRSAPDHIRAIAAPRPPQGLEFLGFRILVTAQSGVRITRD